MKRYLTPLLIVLLFLPIAAIFMFDARYTSLQASLCKAPINDEVKYACIYPERTERDRIVTTAFYRHVADYFGRDYGTSPSWMDEASNGPGGYQIEDTLGVFNREFAIGMLVSIVTASVSGTILTQKLLARRKPKHTK